MGKKPAVWTRSLGSNLIYFQGTRHSQTETSPKFQTPASVSSLFTAATDREMEVKGGEGGDTRIHIDFCY
jgi:hypothetical protein